MKVWLVNKGMYSDWNIVAIKSNEEAARRLMEKCSACNGTGKNPYYKKYTCWDCVEEGKPENNWKEPIVMEVEDD